MRLEIPTMKAQGAAKNEASRTASVEPLFVAGLFYLLMNGAVSLVFSCLNRRMAYYKD